MKRNWLTYVAVVAALVAGSICSTAFAGPPSFKFGGGGGGPSIRSMSGTNNNNNGGNNGSPSVSVRRLQNSGIGTSNGQGLGIQKSPVKVLQGNGNGNGQSFGGMTPQIKKFPGIVGQVQGNGQNKPKFETKPFVPGIVGGIGGNNGNNNNGNGFPKIGKIDQGFNKNGNIGQAIGNAILGGGNGNGNGNGNGQKSIQCGPIKVGCKPWWSDCHHHFHDHCYKPSYPVCTQTIIVQVPVLVEQVAIAQPVMQVPVGSTLTLQSLGLGDVAGQVMLQVDKIAIPAMVNEWTPNAVTTTLPMLGLSSPVIADIVMVRADGTVANSIKVELINALPQAQADGVQPAGVQVDQGGAAAALGGL